MMLSALPSRSSQTTPQHARRGVLMAWSIWVMLAACLMAGGLFNVIWLSGIRNQARHCADSAALAAGHSYLSDDLLRSWQQPFEHDGRTTRCQNAAISIVDEYRRNTSLPPVSKEQVQLAWPETTVLLKNPSMMVPTGISVSFDSNDNKYQVPLFFSGLTGLRNTKLGVCSAVVIEHAPAALRPSPHNCAPMLPFAIFDQTPDSTESPRGAGTGPWADKIESGRGKDNYSWNSSLHQFEYGPDGLPEVIVTISAGTSLSGADAFVPMSFCAVRAGQTSTRIPEWIETGLSVNDLQTLGLQQVSFPGSLPTLSLKSQQLSSISNALQKKIGDACVVCLCAASQSSGTGQAKSGSTTNLSTISLKRPVAARIVQVILGAGGNIKVTLQPCVLTTSTAITASDSKVAANRYVYSVRLCN